jgi:DMSO/TMAO reductase YedYZ molybdopterin-dependent catalytic subunit
MFKEKLIAAKQRWAEKQKSAGVRSRTEAAPDRLPPGQHLTTKFPVLDLGVHPAIPLDEWTLTVQGLIEDPLTLDWPGLNALPQVEDVSDFHCVTTWSKFDCRWGGVAFTTLIEKIKPKPEARYAYFTSYDGYSTNVPLEICLDDDVLVATRFDGEPISSEHGGPARIIIPKLYAWKGAKFVKSIHFLDKDRLGFWEVRGYSNSADPFSEERFS